jgi:hypothetical protein
MISKALITFFLVLGDATPLVGSGPTPAIQRLRRGGAAGVRIRDLVLLTAGVGSILTVFFESFAMKLARFLEEEVCLEGELVVSSVTRVAAALLPTSSAASVA